MQSSFIEAFLAVIQTGSFTKAAEQLFITQPTLTHRIQSLEKEINAQLFYRRQGQRIAELTEAGKGFLSLANKWSALLDESKRVSASLIRPTFTVAATQTLSNYVMPEVYSRFRARGIPVDLSLHTLHFSECYTAVESGQMNVVFVSKAIASPTVGTYHICSEKMMLLCNKDAGYRPNMRPSELPKDKCIYLRWSQEFDAWFDYYFSHTKPSIFADNMRLIENLVATTDMWSIIPISAGRVAARHPQISCLSLADAPPDRPIYFLSLEPQHQYTRYLVDDLSAVMDGIINQP